MFPQRTTKTYLSASLAIGPRAEQSISNEQFLNSYLDVACWLRLLSSRQYLSVVEDHSSSRLGRLAALASFYQTAGLIVEDALTILVAWSLWALDKSRLIADILDRVSLRLSEPHVTLPPTYARMIQDKYVKTDKRLDVYARAYLTELMTVSDADLPSTFAVNWKRHPSVKLVPKDQRPMWDRLGYDMRNGIAPLLDPKGALLASCYNKIKHGPQLILMSPLSGQLNRGFEVDSESAVQSEPTIRLLLRGARTQETPEEQRDNVRIAPFLVLDAQNIRRWHFQQIVHTINVLYIIGTWIFNTTFIGTKRSMAITSPEVELIFREQAEHLHRTFDWPLGEG
jgi:hypothetical protein